MTMASTLTMTSTTSTMSSTTSTMTDFDMADCCASGDFSTAANEASQCDFWVQGVATLTVGLLGLFGNLLCWFVLKRGSERSNVFYSLLMALVYVDSLLIVLAVFDHSVVRSFDWEPSVYVYLVPYLIYPVSSIVVCASIYLVLCIALERHAAVSSPIAFHAAAAERRGAAGDGRVAKLVGGVVLVSSVVNAPKFLETELVYHKTNLNESEWEVDFDVTWLRRHPTYIRLYVHWFSLLATGILPLVALLVLNIRIFVKIRALSARSVRLGVRRHLSTAARHEVGMAVVLVSVVAVFIGCHAPRVALNLSEMLMLEKREACGPAFCPTSSFLCAIAFSHFFLVLNSSVNIVIYCSFGKSFRHTLVEELRPLLNGLCILAPFGLRARDQLENNEEEHEDKEQGQALEHVGALDAQNNAEMTQQVTLGTLAPKKGDKQTPHVVVETEL